MLFDFQNCAQKLKKNTFADSARGKYRLQVDEQEKKPSFKKIFKKLKHWAALLAPLADSIYVESAHQPQLTCSRLSRKTFLNEC